MRHWMVLSVGTFVSVVACSRGVSMPVPLSPILPTQQIYYNDGGNFPDFERLVVRDQARWVDVWARATAGQPNPPSLPVVDFVQEMLIVAAAGPMRPADRIQIDSVGVRGQVYWVFVQTVLGCSEFASDTYPVTIVRVRRDDNPVSFSEGRSQGPSCR